MFCTQVLRRGARGGAFLGSTTGRPAPPVPREGKYFETKWTLVVELSRDCWRSAVGIARSGLGAPQSYAGGSRATILAWLFTGGKLTDTLDARDAALRTTDARWQVTIV